MFQFQCPQGHLLEGDESQAGQQCNCPMCGMLFIIPAPVAPAPMMPPAFPGGSTPPAPAAPQPFVPVQPAYGPAPAAETPAEPGPVIDTGVDRAEEVPVTESAQTLLHIPCPNGHELEVPPDMLDQDVMCPHCEAQFRLRAKDSVEHKRKRKIELEARERRLGNLWLNWAIVVAVLVVIGLLLLILSSRS